MIALLSTMIGGIAGCALAMAGFRKRPDDLTDSQLARLPDDMVEDDRMIAAYREAVELNEARRVAPAPDRPDSVPTHE